MDVCVSQKMNRLVLHTRTYKLTNMGYKIIKKYTWKTVHTIVSLLVIFVLLAYSGPLPATSEQPASPAVCPCPPPGEWLQWTCSPGEWSWLYRCAGGVWCDRGTATSWSLERAVWVNLWAARWGSFNLLRWETPASGLCGNYQCWDITVVSQRRHRGRWLLRLLEVLAGLHMTQCLLLHCIEPLYVGGITRYPAQGTVL